MRIFAIKDKAIDNKIVSYLFYYEKSKKFFIELLDDVSEWDVPFILSSFVKRNIKTIDDIYSRLWVKQRIVPVDRQNIASILKDNKLKQYDEFELLLLNSGRCAQDDCFISEIDYEELPEYIKQRNNYRINDVVALDNYRLLVFFNNGETKLCELSKIIETESSINRLLSIYPQVYKDIKIEVGGYNVNWDLSQNITSEVLYKEGEILNISKDDICSFVTNNLINTAEACEILKCSRQYIEYLISQDKLKPIKITDKGKLFLKSDIEKIEWK